MARKPWSCRPPPSSSATISILPLLRPCVMLVDHLAETANAFDARIGLFEMHDQHFAAGVAQHFDHRLAGQLAASVIVGPHVPGDVHLGDFAFQIAGEDRDAGLVGLLDRRPDGDAVGRVQHNRRDALGQVVFDVLGLLLHVPFGVADDHLEAVAASFFGQRVGDDLEERILRASGPRSRSCRGWPSRAASRLPG